MSIPVTLKLHCWGLIALLIMLGINSSCALTAKQKMAVSQFSDAATKLGDLSSTEMIAMHDITVKMTIERLLLGGKSLDPNLGDHTSLDRGFELNRVATVSGATEALGAYGMSLAALVNDTQSANLKTASEKFVASLGKIPEAKAQLDDKQLEAIGSIVQDVGGLWVEWKRKQAVTTIVKESQKAVDQLCDLLVRDFKPDVPNKGWIALQLEVVENPLMAVATNALYDGESYDDRKVALDAFRLAYESQMSRTEVLGRISNAATAMKKANKALVAAIEDSTWSTKDIQEFAKEAQSLQTAVKLLVAK